MSTSLGNELRRLNEHLNRFMISYDSFGEPHEIPLEISRHCSYPVLDQNNEAEKFSLFKVKSYYTKICELLFVFGSVKPYLTLPVI